MENLGFHLTETGRVFVKPPQVACHDMFKLMDRQSLIEGLHPKGDSPPTLDAGTIEFEDVKFFYPFRPEIQVALKNDLELSKKRKRSKNNTHMNIHGNI